MHHGLTPAHTGKYNKAGPSYEDPALCFLPV